jgi:putative acetyltransferase
MMVVASQTIFCELQRLYPVVSDVKMMILVKMKKIRQATKSDVKSITELFYETIQNINIRDYSKEEVDDWSSWSRDVEKWEEEVVEQYFVLYEIEDKIVGFSSITKDGYLDFMFTHKDFQGKGIAKRMLTELEKKAIQQGNDFIYSDVSITAKDFFLSQGYKVEKQQLKCSKEKELINFRMTKQLKDEK